MMRSRIALGIGALFCFNSLIAADAKWTRIATPNFEMYTTASERSAHDTLRYFEQIRSFFDQAMPHPLDNPTVVRIVAFNSAKEYEPYRLNEFATAYYHSSGDYDYIVMSHAGAETFPVATHEYVHLVVRHSNLKLPPWLNEGIAELYSTIKPMGDKVLVGSLVEGRFQHLLMEKWVPLAAIIAAGHDSPYYNEKNKAGSLYNEGWALTHMLALSPDYRGKFSQVLLAISNGKPSIEALEEIYGKPLGKIENDLQGYLRGGRFQGTLIPAKLTKVDEELKAQPADEFDIALLLIQVSDRPGKEAEMKTALEGLIAKNPNRAESHLDLGYIEWRQHDSEAARNHFAKAYDLGSRSPRMLWDYGRMTASADAPKSIQALSELLKLDANRLEVRLELASVQLRSHAATDALQTLEPVKKVTPEDAPKLLSIIAYASLETGDRAKARTAATQWKSVAKSGEDQDRANQMISYLDGSAMREARASEPVVRSSNPAAAPASTSTAPPVLKRRDAPETTFVEQSAAVNRASFIGNFVELQCQQNPRIVVQTAQGKKVVMIDNPGLLMVNGKNGEKMDLTCGAQKPRQVRLEYDPPGSNHPGVDGLARAIHFEP